MQEYDALSLANASFSLLVRLQSRVYNFAPTFALIECCRSTCNPWISLEVPRRATLMPRQQPEPC